MHKIYANRKCSHVLMGTFGELWELFSDAKQKKMSKTVYAKNVRMFKKKEMKVMGILILHKIMNLPFHDHIFIGGLQLMCKLLKIG